MIYQRIVKLRTWILLISIACIPFAALAEAADSSSTSIAMSNTATPGAVADAYLGHAKAIQKTNAQIISLLNRSDYQQSVPLLQKAAQDPDNSWAADTLGHLYSAGLGVPANRQQAFRFYLRAAKTGDHFAQRQVANDYLNGWGVAPSPQRAAFWFRQGLMVPQVANADYWLGKDYAEGRFLPKNPAKAHWYQQQSLQLLHKLYAEKVGAAAYDLGVAALQGTSGKKDPAGAEQYFRIALTWHYPPAANALKRMQKENNS